VPVPDNGRFRAGGVTQALVATAVLQLADEHRLSLDDPAVRFVPEFDLDRRITVRMLLQHTSGIFSYTGEHAPDGKFEPGIPLHGQEYVDNLFRTYQPAELVGLALAQPPPVRAGRAVESLEHQLCPSGAADRAPAWRVLRRSDPGPHSGAAGHD
jgi:D-alanyl-D-alanine carboxypeptidase